MFRFFEQMLEPTELPPSVPPAGLGAFYWHFVRQARGLVIATLIIGLALGILDSLLPAFIGQLVSMLTSETPATLVHNAWPILAVMAVVVLVVRPIVGALQALVLNQALAPGLGNLVRWQNHWHVVRQGWTFFQNDFAGRIANRVMQTGPSVRQSVLSVTTAVIYILVFGLSSVFLLGQRDWRLAVPVVIWFAGYTWVLRAFVPSMRERSRAQSERNSTMTGRVVDAYTNIITVKLFAKPRDEDAFVREAIDHHTDAFRHKQQLVTVFQITLMQLNALLLVGTGTIAVDLWVRGTITVGAVAMTLPLIWQITNSSGWVAQNVTDIFENVGVVQDGMKTIAVERTMSDRAGASALKVKNGRIRFEHIYFGYGTERGVLHDIDLEIAPGERVGLIGRSGAGKSTLVNVLLRFFDLEQGRITIDGADIASVTQETLRGQIAMVTQDTSLLHRSVAENIRYGRPDATDVEVRDSARRAHALEFIETLEDFHGNRGFDALVGERGVKLSGGQRQRIALARVILKNAPILILDEATSALDSEAEAMIQEQLDELMDGRTVLAIAHRLSTIAKMDRLIVLDQGSIIEEGTHADLLSLDGTYARLWARQVAGRP
jgi:ATP-binding cassette subfamily B multidrug efflux pump